MTDDPFARAHSPRSVRAQASQSLGATAKPTLAALPQALVQGLSAIEQAQRRLRSTLRDLSARANVGSIPQNAQGAPARVQGTDAQAHTPAQAGMEAAVSAQVWQPILMRPSVG